MRTLAELMDLRGRVGLVTGAGGGIGRVICQGLCELGCDLLVVDRDEITLKLRASELHERYGVRLEAMCIDLEREELRATCADRIWQTFGRLDILVNNAAFVGDSSLTGWAVPFEQQELSTWRRAVEVNLTACFHLSQTLAALLSQEGGGSVVNIGSIYGVVGPDMRMYADTEMGNPAAYAASKGGLVQLTRWLSTVMAPTVRVNCISPGGVSRGQPQSFIDNYIARTPLRRMATEEDFMGAVAFLGSDLSQYVTGQNLIVDGGWTAW